MANLDILVKKFNIDILEFVVNTAAYDKMLRMNIDRDKSGRFAKKINNEENKKSEDNDENLDETKTESIDEISTSEELQKETKNNIYKLIQYYTNESVMNIIKNNMDLKDYIHFIKQSTKNVKTNIPLEKYLINNISCAKLLELLKAFDNELANEVINKMSDIVFNI